MDQSSKFLKTLFPLEHKTIFLLDHTPKFQKPCDIILEIDLEKSSAPVMFPLTPIYKSFWTCSVEASMEYFRIVSDIFPEGKLIRFIASDTTAHNVNSWTRSQQNKLYLLNSLAQVGAPLEPSEREGEYSLNPGLEACVHAMSECSYQQHEKRTTVEKTFQVLNRCRIICITSAESNDFAKVLEDKLQLDILQENQAAMASDSLLPVDACHLVIINVTREEIILGDVQCHQVSNILDVELHHVNSAEKLTNKLLSLVVSHYNLASTTVTGIPMKMEQSAGSSAIYDVEVFHPAKIHEALFKGCGIDVNVIRSQKQGFEYDTVTLQWCTPRNCVTEQLRIAASVHRFTPVDVNSRPSICLKNFLFGGNSVMLESTRRSRGKVFSHMLSAKAGSVYIHSFNIGRSLFEDLPSINEGPGGRVKDYRITDFGSFMRSNTLCPMNSGKSMGSKCKKTRQRLERQTKFWPMTVSATTIFNYKQYLEPILTLMLKPELGDSDVIKCKQCIYNLVSKELNNEPLISIGQKRKGPNREAQYKQIWTELEGFLRALCVTDKHISVLNCFLEVRSRDLTSDADGHVDQVLKELKQLSSERVSDNPATTDSSLSPDATPPTPKTVLQLWNERFGNQNPRPKFAGLSSAVPMYPGGPSQYKLYANMEKGRSLSKPKKDADFN